MINAPVYNNKENQFSSTAQQMKMNLQLPQKKAPSVCSTLSARPAANTGAQTARQPFANVSNNLPLTYRPSNQLQKPQVFVQPQLAQQQQQPTKPMAIPAFNGFNSQVPKLQQQAQPKPVQSLQQQAQPAQQMNFRASSNSNSMFVKEKEVLELPIDSYVEEYAEDIMSHLRVQELKYLPFPYNYMEKQTEITSTMRSVLIDWLIDVHNKFRYLPGTLFLAVNFMDRFLSKKLVDKSKLQLIGVSALMIAAKYEEIVTCDIEEYVKITANAYQTQELLDCEGFMLNTLNFNLNAPTSWNFLSYYYNFAKDKRVQFIACYVSEVALLDGKLVAKYPPSLIAACSLYIAHMICDMPEFWNSSYARLTACTEEMILPIAKFLVKSIEQQIYDPSKKSKYQACFRKYASKRRMEIINTVSQNIQQVSKEIDNL